MSMFKKITKTTCLVLALATAAPAAFVAPAQAAVGFGVTVGEPGFGPPRARFERPNNCGREYYFRGGRWTWRDGRYAWVRGECYRTPARFNRQHWNPGHWDRRGRNWVWIEGSFR